MIGSASLTRAAIHVQAAAIQWAKSAVHGGSAVSCLESAVRVASLGVLDKGAETREAGTALMLALAQVSLLLPLLSELAWQLVLRACRCPAETSMNRPLAAPLQEHGRAQITAAIGHLAGPAKKAASEAFEKVAASKSGMAALQEPGSALEAAHTSTESTLTNGGSRPSSRGAHVAQVDAQHSLQKFQTSCPGRTHGGVGSQVAYNQRHCRVETALPFCRSPFPGRRAVRQRQPGLQGPAWR